MSEIRDDSSDTVFSADARTCEIPRLAPGVYTEDEGMWPVIQRFEYTMLDDEHHKGKKQESARRNCARLFRKTPPVHSLCAPR